MRDIRIDLLRGYAMLTIAINHLTALLVEVGLHRRPVPTLTGYGFSSAAELFFLLSGYMVGLVYIGRPGLRRKVWSRARKIYLYNLGAFVVALGIAWAAGPPVSVATASEPFLAEPTVWIPRFLVLMGHPDLLGVLSTYVLLLFVTPLIVWAARRSPAVAIITSCSVYAAAQIFPQFNIPGGTPAGNGLWNFNPFAWQFLFFAGALAGWQGALQKLFDWLGQRKGRQASALLLLLVLSLSHGILKPLIPAVLINKDNLGVLRLLHTGTVLTALCSAIILLKRYQTTFPARIIALCGRQTLNCYAATIPLTYGMAVAWIYAGKSYPSYFASVIAMLGAVMLVAWMTEYRRSKRSVVRTA